MRKTYIQNNDLSVFDDYLDYLGELELESQIIPTIEGLNRVVKQAIYARNCDPMYNAAAMDGIAVVAQSTLNASESNPLTLTLNKDFVYINTGVAIKGKYNAVIMIEEVIEQGNGTVQIISPAYPWQHIRVKGESIVEGEMIVPSYHVLRPVDIGAIFASGNTEISVVRKPKLAIIPTGNEMVNEPSLLKDGHLMESNSKMFAAMASELNAKSYIYPICKDDKNELEKAIMLATNHSDIVIVNAGSSAGTKDYTVNAIARLGEVFAHGFAIKPGKPTILGKVNGKPVIGVPGYPVSAYIVFENFVKPILCAMQGLKAPDKPKTVATLSRNIPSSFKNTEIVRVSLGEVNNKLVATPLERGAAQIMSLVKADGLISIDRLCEGLQEGSKVEVMLNKPLDKIKQNLVVIGSHDLIIDVLGDKMPITSAHTGSLGGIMAMLKGECHIAPIHLLDEDSGVYNISYVKKYFVGKNMALIKGVGRAQGLMLQKGNPHNINTIGDIAKTGLPFANRQRGAGTRILFDYLLKQNNIPTNLINSYEKEYNTHLAVAVAIENDVAKVGLGIGSVAKLMGLDFIKVGQEQYDFLTTEENLQDERIQKFIALLSSQEIKQKFLEFGDYTVDHLGEIEIIKC
ncbi:MAG: molybdopterin biosynthesis protein [Clostridiales bacterium]|nr:molybdopterin biosynthesis protein [Clostridiales bacterium]